VTVGDSGSDGSVGSSDMGCRASSFGIRGSRSRSIDSSNGNRRSIFRFDFTILQINTANTATEASRVRAIG